MYTAKQQSSSITVDQAYKTNSSQRKEVKPSHPSTLPLFYKVNSQSLQPLCWRDYGDNGYPRNRILCNTRESSQFIRCIPLSKRKAKIIKKSGRSLCVSKKIYVLQVYFTSKSWPQIWWCVNQSFKYTFHQCFYTYGLRKTVLCLCACFYHTDLEHNLFFLALFKSIILQFFTVLRDKLRSLNTQYDRSTRLL